VTLARIVCRKRAAGLADPFAVCQRRPSRPWQQAYVEKMLCQEWSNEQVTDVLRSQGGFNMSFQTIYRHPRRD
jgi:IS30 family transposase